MMLSTQHKGHLKRDQAPAGSWSWFKEWTGYLVTLLPYVSSGIVLIPGMSVLTKAIILLAFAVIVLSLRILHEKAGIEVTSNDERKKKPHAR